MSVSADRPALTKIIGQDLMRTGKIPLLLLLLVLLSALVVVLTTHRVRLLIAEREQLILQKDTLDIEWRNLILEEHSLGDHRRVEQLATEKLQMQNVTPAQENIVVQQ